MNTTTITDADFITQEGLDEIKSRINGWRNELTLATPDKHPLWFRMLGNFNGLFPDKFDKSRSIATERLAQYEAGLVRTSTCSTCKQPFKTLGILPYLHGSGVIKDQDWGAMDVCQPCHWEREYRQRLQSFTREYPVGRYYIGQSGKPPRPRQYQQVTEWEHEAGSVKRGLLLFGGSYLGKTTSLVHWCHRMMRKNRDHDYSYPRIITSSDLAEIPERARAGTLRPWMDDLQLECALVIDDLDKAKFTPTVSTELWGLLEQRLRSDYQTTHITMNTRSKAKFISLFAGRDADDSRKVGESIYNRLMQHLVAIDFDKQ